MKADRVQNMNYLIGGDNYRNKTRVNQAPGGNTSLSLGWGDSNPYEHRRGRVDHQPVNGYGLNQSVETNSRFPQQSSYQQQEPKNTFNGLYGLQEARRAKLQPLDDPFKRSWNDGQRFMDSNVPKSPMENAYIKHKQYEEPRYESYEPTNNYQHAATTTHYQASQYENQERGHEERGQLRSRSQVSSLQNNGRNIMNDFSSTRYAMESPKNSFTPQFRATADQANKWSGIRVTNPPGGGSSFKLWG